MDTAIQQEKAAIFRNLHSGKSVLILPNIWDPLGASLLQDIGYPAVATASASISYTQGVADSEQLQFGDLLNLLKRIAGALSIPVTADIESGYAKTEEQLRGNIEQLLEAGIVGINIEDFDLDANRLFSVEAQCRRLEIVRAAANAAGIPLFINARTDMYLKSRPDTPDAEKWSETCRRGKAYLQAGADSIYPIMMNREKDIGELVAALSCPVNILAMPGIPDLPALQALGVARLSLGPGFLKVAIRAMRQAALALQAGTGLAEITGNPIGNDYLRKLIGSPA